MKRHAEKEGKGEKTKIGETRRQGRVEKKKLCQENKEFLKYQTVV